MPDEPTGRLAGRLSAALYLLCGSLLVVAVSFLPMAPDADRGGLLAVALIAIVMGSAIAVIPWYRWPRSTTLVLLPPTFGLITLHNQYVGGDGYRFAPFFYVTFAWIGLCHRRWTSAFWAPVAAVAYLVPMWTTHHWSAVGASSIAYVLPSCVLLGESIGWVSDRLARTQRSLEIREAGNRKLFAENPQPMWLYDATSLQFLEVNAAAILHYGYTREEFLAMRAVDVVADRAMADAVADEHAQGIQAEGRLASRHRARDGQVIEVETTSHQLTFDAHDAVLVSIQDVTDRNRFEEQLRHRAFHDELTELANRSLFSDRVEHALARRPDGDGSIAVVMVDLDGFKTINDSLGHTHGDELLIVVARRLHSSLRTGDTASRFGGDEFAILFEDVEGIEDVTRRAERILDALRRPIALAGKHLFVTASFGIALNRPGDSSEELLRNADTAMYLAKASGKSCIRVFEPTMHRAAIDRLETEAELRRAVTTDELVVHYQPTLRLATGAVCGFEALVRWQHPERGLLTPRDFIGLAEETGLIVELGSRVLSEACHQLRVWRDAYPELDLTVAVNLSGRQIRDAALVDDVAAVLGATGLEGRCLTLEVTETTLLGDTAAAGACLDALKRLGVRVAMDDFGTGYSSLSYLRSLPIDVLKVDKTFIEGVEDDPEAIGLVEAIIRMAKTLGLETIAEGVESDAQLRRLRQLGASSVQGFYFSAPLPVAAVSDFLQRQIPLTAKRAVAAHR